MLTIVNWQKASLKEKRQRLRRAPQLQQASAVIKHIINVVREGGDAAVKAFTEQFDRVALSSLAVSELAVNRAQISEKALAALHAAIETITYYHEMISPKATRVKTANGIIIERKYKPIQRVGLYVPGGQNTPLISSLLMQAIPARLAGCPLRILCTPPTNNGSINPHLLVAAKLCGIETIYTVGGAQAIAAMAYGTETIPKVDKLFGPGNSYVTEAKALVSMDPEGAAIDMPAGPSEVMIVADNQANPNFIAADLLAQAEHGPDSQVLALCETQEFAMRIIEAVGQQLPKLSRKTIIQQSFEHSAIIVCPDRLEQLAIINDYAPEHLIINCGDAEEWIDKISSAGTVFLGPWAAETLGDYVTGSNHVLPTNGYARNHSGLATIDFLKTITMQSIEKEGLQSLGPAACILANLEGLDAHAQAVQLRLDALGDLK